MTKLFYAIFPSLSQSLALSDYVLSLLLLFREESGERRMASLPSLRQILLLQRDVPAAAQFYKEGLGLTVSKIVSDKWAELDAGDGATRITLMKSNEEAPLSRGYSPILTFNVSDLDGTVLRLLRLGASLDGPIRFPVHGKVASLRAPDGQMVGLYEESGDEGVNDE